MNVAIVGSGHGGCAMAGTLAMAGHDVTVVKLTNSIHVDNWNAIQERKTIRLSGIEGSGEFPIHATTKPEQALPTADLVLIFYVSNYHERVAKSCAPHLNSRQIVALNPGYAGSLLFHAEMRAAGNTSFPLFAEFETLPYSSRITAPGTVDIASRNVRHPFATWPASRSSELIERIGPVLGECVPRKHLLEVALHNPNLVTHVIGMLMNIPAIERPDSTFSMYQHGFSSSIWNLVDVLDAEKMDVLERLGAPRIPYLDEFRLRTFGTIDMEGADAFRRYASEAPDGPFVVDHRYLTEDVPMGLGLLHSLGRATGVHTPVCDSLINIANAVLPSYDFWKEARTIEKLWSGTLEELLAMLTK